MVQANTHESCLDSLSQTPSVAVCGKHGGNQMYTEELKPLVKHANAPLPEFRLPDSPGLILGQ